MNKNAISSKLVATLAAAILSLSVSPVLAQSFDTSGLGGPATHSLGDTGAQKYVSAKTGQGLGDRALYGNDTAVTGIQRGSLTTGLGHLMLPQVSTGGLAPVFGYGAQPLAGPVFTTPLDDPYTVSLGSNSSLTVVPSTGATYLRAPGGVRTGVTFDGNGNPQVTVKTQNGYGLSSGSGGLTPSLGGLGGIMGGGGSVNVNNGSSGF